ncbi:hypothetical protein ACF0H5_006649 [Mactra antiquata]
MMPLWRLVPRTQSVLCKSIQTGAYPTKPVLDLPVSILGLTSNSDAKKSFKMNQDIVCVEGVQGELKEFSVSEARRVMSLASDYQCQGPSVQGTQAMQENYVTGLTSSDTVDNLSNEDVHSSVHDGLSRHVSLHGCMQTTVPQPGVGMASIGYGSHLSMPGGGNKLLDKYLSGSSIACHQSRHFSTCRIGNSNQQGAQEMSFEEEYLTDPTPQGVQGDNCVRFKLWMENCQRYNLPNCDEQFESLKNGRKTLAQVFQEQQDIIKLVAEQYRSKNQQLRMDVDTNAQGQQDYFGYSYEYSLDEPCPQGLQGDDCANYKVWAHNCRAFGFGDCQEKMRDISSGRRSLQDVFNEQDQLIRNIVSSYQQKRQYSTSSKQEWN